MTLKVANIGVDCVDVWNVANFWAAALGRPVDEGSSDVFASIGAHDTLRGEPAWFFHKVPELKSAKNRMHADLIDPDPELVAKLVGLGATVVQEHDLGFHRWTVMEDPEGNVFCVAAKVYSG
jgi:Glyoxalase-like domain